MATVSYALDDLLAKLVPEPPVIRLTWFVINVADLDRIADDLFSKGFDVSIDRDDGTVSAWHDDLCWAQSQIWAQQQYRGQALWAGACGDQPRADRRFVTT